MVFILDGNSEHDALAWGKRSFFLEQIIRFMTVLDPIMPQTDQITDKAAYVRTYF